MKSGTVISTWHGSTAAIALAAMLLVGCKKEDMAVQQKVRTYEPTPVFSDGSEARPLVAGTVARPPDMSPGMPYVQAWAPGPAGYSDSARAQWIPMPVTRELIDRGAQRFDIYCAVCHGRLGDGTGMIVRRGFVPPPSFHNARLSDPKQTPDSHFYDVISNGYGAMFSYNERVAPADRWAIAAYIRVLQASVKQAAREGRITREEYKAMQGVRP